MQKSKLCCNIRKETVSGQEDSGGFFPQRKDIFFASYAKKANRHTCFNNVFLKMYDVFGKSLINGYR